MINEMGSPPATDGILTAGALTLRYHRWHVHSFPELFLEKREPKRKDKNANLPGELFSGRMPLEHLPKYHRTGEHIYLVVVFWMRVPKFWRLPIYGPNKTTNHGSSRLLHLG